MKTIYTTILLLFFGMLYQPQCLGQTVLSTSVYANFSGLQCDGKHQLCAMEESGGGNANALLVNNQDGTVSLRIDRATISASDTEKLFGEAYNESFRNNPVAFGIQKEVVLTTSMQQALQTNSSTFKLTQGFYPIEVTDSHFIITFTLE